MGNLRSVAKALEAAGARVRLADTHDAISTQDGLCVPGQGIFGRCVRALEELNLSDAIRGWIGAGKPFLGICLGMQVLYRSSEEGDGAPGLGILGGRAVRLPHSSGVRVPHIGWNTVGPDYYYFDHSYAVVPDEPAEVIGWCEHGLRFAAHVERGPLVGVQFHPEKSGVAGIDLLRRWVARA